MAIAGITSMASSGSSQFQVNATLTEVTEIRAAVDSWAGANSDVTGVSLTEICQEGYGYSKATWCSSNQFGGTYTVTANTNTSFVDILIGDVDPEVTMALGNKLAPVSADRCSRADGSCATVQVSGTDVTVTM
ncbi:hypothetical protein JCM19232_4974 [Vibrio ishigakensis]|uniref:Uncharacterized protein n=1 Tax=Vibrio ishigakensis TaxID=1481914 RepID=A0A0B8PS68_9VIBR|nr:hypothetical protein JCM19232_4974 [Vibrio ishigakensis]